MSLSRSGISSLALAAFACVPFSLRAQPAPHPDELALKPKIDAAIDGGVEFLLEQQFRDGSWGLHAHLGGRAGLTLYTLLQCGVPRDHPAVIRAVKFLDSVEPTATYATATMILAYDALRQGRKKKITRFVQKLIDWQKPHGDWGYPGGAADLSNTQYAALGLWVGLKRGIDIDENVFAKLIGRLEDYREEPRKIDNPDLEPGRTGVAKVEVAGFRYHPNSEDGKTTGSMTGAGIAALAIAKAGMGRKLKRPMQGRIDDLAKGGLRWLNGNWSVAKNPNGGHHLYYLYGLERVGGLLQTEQVGEHWWYIEGARHLLKRQRRDNGWGSVTDTCFALLFLRRATSSSRSAVTGRASEIAHVFRPRHDRTGIRLRGAGQRPLSLWIDGFDERVSERHEQFGLRVVSVRYEDERGEVLGKVAGDPTRTWSNDTFLFRDKAIQRGVHKLRALVTVMAPGAAPGSEETEDLESGWMDVKIRDVIAPWMEDSAGMFRENLLRGAEPEYSVSSKLDDKSGPQNLCDGQDGTCWFAAEDDAEPTVSISWKAAVRIGSVTVMLPAQHEDRLKDFEKIDGVEVRLGRDRKWQRIPMPHDKIAPLTLPLDKPRRLREIELRFYGREQLPKKKVGVSELILLPPKWRGKARR